MKEFLMCRFDDSKFDENSIVVDIGAHRGQFIDFFNKYNCYIYSYEPVRTFYDDIKSKESAKVKIYNFAVWKEDNKEIEIFEYGISSSLYKQSGRNFHNRRLKSKNTIKTISINTILDSMDVVDLLKINVEGSEVEIMKSISTENIKKCDQICIQTHMFLKDRFDDKKVTDDKEIKSIVKKIRSCGFSYEEWGKGPNYYFWKE